jgi:hypothetical protein
MRRLHRLLDRLRLLERLCRLLERLCRLLDRVCLQDRLRQGRCRLGCQMAFRPRLGCRVGCRLGRLLRPHCPRSLHKMLRLHVPCCRMMRDSCCKLHRLHLHHRRRRRLPWGRRLLPLGVQVPRRVRCR